jgi:rhomboid family protein
MVMPLYDDNTDRHCTPFVNYAIIAINVFVFVVFQGMGTNDRFTYTYSAVPYEILTGTDIQESVPVIDPRTGRQARDPETGKPAVIQHYAIPVSVYFTLLTSIFMHGSIAHIGGNMLFLWIFGDNVEDALGHFRYVVFYLVCGVMASLSHVFATAMLSGLNSLEAKIPSLGASGAISGVLGAYLLLFPQKRVMAIVGRMLTEVPAWVAVGMWFLFQLIEGLGMLGGGGSGGVAYAAHIGGFIFGCLLVLPFMFGRDGEASQLRVAGRAWH